MRSGWWLPTKLGTHAYVVYQVLTGHLGLGEGILHFRLGRHADGWPRITTSEMTHETAKDRQGRVKGGEGHEAGRRNESLRRFCADYENSTCYDHNV